MPRILSAIDIAEVAAQNLGYSSFHRWEIGLDEDSVVVKVRAELARRLRVEARGHQEGDIVV